MGACTCPACSHPADFALPPQIIVANHNGERAWAHLTGFAQDGSMEFYASIRNRYRPATLREICEEFHRLTGKDLPVDEGAMLRWWVPHLKDCNDTTLDTIDTVVHRAAFGKGCKPCVNPEHERTMMCDRVDCRKAKKLRTSQGAAVSAQVTADALSRRHTVHSIGGMPEVEDVFDERGEVPWDQEFLDDITSLGARPRLHYVVEVQKQSTHKMYRCVFVNPTGRLEGDPSDATASPLWLKECLMWTMYSSSEDERILWAE